MTIESPPAPVKEFERIRYEVVDDVIARVVLARPEVKNAQDKQLLYELNDTFDIACQDNDIRVIVLAADGTDFSSGHDLRDFSPWSEQVPVTGQGGFDLPKAEGHMAREAEICMGLSWRWRNLPKPMIAEVQGRVIAGGLMLIWPCDIIVASEDARFSDPVVAFGLNGHEYFTHVWELGARKAKEFLFFGDQLTAAEALALGMVNRVVPLDELESTTMGMARRLAERPTMGVKLAKMSVNQSLDAQGMWSAIQAAFGLHELAHAHNMAAYDSLIARGSKEVIRGLSGANRVSSRPGLAE